MIILDSSIDTIKLMDTIGYEEKNYTLPFLFTEHQIPYVKPLIFFKTIDAIEIANKKVTFEELIDKPEDSNYTSELKGRSLYEFVEAEGEKVDDRYELRIHIMQHFKVTHSNGVYDSKQLPLFVFVNLYFLNPFKSYEIQK